MSISSMDAAFLEALFFKNFRNLTNVNIVYHPDSEQWYAELKHNKSIFDIEIDIKKIKDYAYMESICNKLLKKIIKK